MKKKYLKKKKKPSPTISFLLSFFLSLFLYDDVLFIWRIKKRIEKERKSQISKHYPLNFKPSIQIKQEKQEKTKTKTKTKEETNEHEQTNKPLQSFKYSNVQTYKRTNIQTHMLGMNCVVQCFLHLTFIFLFKINKTKKKRERNNAK